MGCFLACFGSKKEKERRRRKNRAKRVLPKDQRNGYKEPLQPTISLNKDQRNDSEEPLHPISPNKDQRNYYEEPLQPTISLNKYLENICDVPCQPTISLNKDTIEECITPSTETRYELEEQLSLSVRKKVTFDLNVKTYEGESTQDNKDFAGEDEKERKDTEERGAKQSRLDSLSEDNSSSTSMGSFPSNHRYQNCSNSDDEYGAESEESDLDDDDDDGDELDDYCDDRQQIVQEESSESFFSLPSALQRHGSETPLAEKEVNSPLIREPKASKGNTNIRDRSEYLHSVLNPVENLTQWKAVKMSSKPPLKQRKENTAIEHEVQIPFSSEPSFRFSPFSSNSKKDCSVSPKEDITVDTSLSNWLGSSETTPSTKTSNLNFGFKPAEGSKPQSQISGSPRSHEDRPILGALTVEELRQFSATSSPRKSPSRSPDEMPILGTVGSYWSHTGQAVFSATSSPRKSPSRSPDEMPILGTVGTYWSHTGQTVDSSSGSSCKGIPNTTSKYREDKRVNWHSTPFETRLEKVLNRDDAEAYPSK